MATVYGSTIQSTWRSYLTYTVSETATQYVINITDVGIQLTGSTYIVEPDDYDSAFTCTLKLGSKTSTASLYSYIDKTESNVVISMLQIEL